ncbi:MAG TPA: hypothetical protein VEV16_09890 [Daejeonella sp.]|nr:hypothetical protein [Daejeonella sp.]
MSHTFHIPVLGLAFSIDTPLKVARYGISSVVSIVDDILIERMRKFHSEKAGEIFTPIHQDEPHFRSRRITAYLNLLQKIVDRQFEKLRQEPFIPGTDISRYFNLLPDHSILKQQYQQMLKMPEGPLKSWQQNRLRQELKKGFIDVNIMSKVDRMILNEEGQMQEDQLSDALAALQGFALSQLDSSLILSAGMNPRLYSYLENFPDFFPDEHGQIKKRVILKVSDFRSAFIQAKFLAKKGIWVSEFRIESGLNCGGHAFATEGYLLGPILEEFKNRKPEMLTELFAIYREALAIKNVPIADQPAMKISVQGGIGTAQENNFLLSYYQLDATGWGSPFLLVPEATNVDQETLESLATARHDDFYISRSSPLGIPFNNFRKSTAEKLRLERIAKGRPGSPCTKKYLVSNTEFTSEPICTASREYQNLKIKELQEANLPAEQFQQRFEEITEKVCLCEGLATSAYLKNDIAKARENKAVAICPGPNLAWFSGSFSLDEMIHHIYGKLNLLNSENRSNLFINELDLYLKYFKEEVSQHLNQVNDKKNKYLIRFKEQLNQGISYYKQLIPQLTDQTELYRKKMLEELQAIEQKLNTLQIAN